jgi:hypothetical protein
LKIEERLSAARQWYQESHLDIPISHLFSPKQLEDAFESLVKGPLMVEEIVHPLVSLAFLLIGEFAKNKLHFSLFSNLILFRVYQTLIATQLNLRGKA